MPEFASLEGKNALVTGGSRGIGRAIALELAKAGASVVVGYQAGKDEAEAVAQEAGGRAVQADVSSAEEAARLVEDAGELDILVNNAGLTRDGLGLVLPRLVADDDRGAGPRQLQRNRAADPSRPPGDERVLAFQRSELGHSGGRELVLELLQSGQVVDRDRLRGAVDPSQ